MTHRSSSRMLWLTFVAWVLHVGCATSGGAGSETHLARCTSDAQCLEGGADVRCVKGDCVSGGSSGSGGSGTGGSGTGGASKGTGGASKGDGGPSDAGVVTVSGTAVDYSGVTAATNIDLTKYPALAGLQVCVYNDTSVPCATTDSKGAYSITGAPLEQPFYLSYKKTGYTPTLYDTAIGGSSGRYTNAPTMLMTTTTFTNSFETQGGVPLDDTKGTIWFGAAGGDPPSAPIPEMLFGAPYLKGYTVTISPAAAAGPVYIGSNWKPDKTLTTSSEAGWGLIQASPGTYTLTFTHPTKQCGGPVQALVVAGYTTLFVGVFCLFGTTDGGKTTDAGSMDAAPHPG